MADPRDVQLLALLGYYEARDQGTEGMAGVMHTAVNRTKRPDRFGGPTLRDVISAPYQFTSYEEDRWARFDPRRLDEADRRAWARSFQLASGVLNGTIPDPTGGADHYLNPEVTKQQNKGRLPTWTRKYTKTANLGQHVFYHATD